MAKILTFRNKGTPPSGQGFLTDENQTLSFRTTEDGDTRLGNLSDTVLPDLFPDPKKDWSNQELADLFRVRQLLTGANVAVETDRGITDEGDPWFVFCHGNGEVFIHLCRIDGLYLLDSPNVQRPLQGADFGELIADFTNQALPSEAEQDSERRVIKLERGGKVRLHPSAMLAALIWTLFLASEELVLMAPEEEVINDDALLNFDGMFAVETAEEAALDLPFDTDTLDTDALLKDETATAEIAAPETQGQLREAMSQQQGLTVQNNAFTMGLSTLAIAMGFMSETVLLENQRKVLESLKLLGFTETGEETRQVAELDVPADEDGQALLAMLAEFLGLDLADDSDLAEVTFDKDTGTTQQDPALLSGELIDGAATVLPVKAPPEQLREKDLDAEIAEELAEAPRETQDTLTPVADEETLVAETVSDASALTLAAIVETWQPQMEEFQLGQTTVKSSFDISDTDAFMLFDLIETATDQRTTNFREFDAMAQMMIDFLEAKDGEFGVIELANEILFIDRTAAVGGEIEAMQWETSDGKIITLVGLQSDFQQFDMIA